MKELKKYLAVLLCAAMLATVLCPGMLSLAADNSLKIAVGSDLHFQLQSDTLPINSPQSELFFQASGSGILYDEVEAIVDEFLDGCAAEGVDCVFIPGDITRNGDIEQHAAIAEVFADFEDETGIPIYVAVGNHDMYNSTTEQFKSIYQRFGFDEAIAVDDVTASYTVDLPGGYRLISIDSCAGKNEGDSVDSKLYSWIEAQALSAISAGKKPVAMLHHPIMEHIPLHSVLMKDFILTDWKTASARFADFGIKYVFSGHEHGNDIARFVSPAGNEVYDVTTAALTTYPLSYRIVTFSEENVSFDNAFIDSIDMSTLIPGYNDAQKALMESDYSAYALGVFKRSIEYKIANTISAEKIKKKLGGDDSALAGAIDLLMPLVDEALAMPMYRTQGGANSIEELANKNGASLPKSDYTSLYDLVSTLVATHYRGDENLPFGTAPEGTLVIMALNTGLKYILTSFGDDAVTALVAPLAQLLGLDSIGTIRLEKWCASLIDGGDDSYELAEAFLAPLLSGFLVDTAPADNIAVLPAYNAKVEKPDFFANLLAFIKQAFEYISAILAAYVKVIF